MSDWLVGRPLPTAGLRLLTFPHAGGGASAFARWQSIAGAGAEVLRVQYPGRENLLDEEPLPCLDRLADRITDAVRAIRDGRPLALFGHSMGALVAAEVAHRLQNDGCGADLLVASGSLAPQVRAVQGSDPRGLSDQALLQELYDLGGTHVGVLADEELRELVLPVARADLTAVFTYRYRHRTRLSCPITAWAGRDDADLDASDIERWREITTGEFRVNLAPGGHFFLWEAGRDILTDLTRSIEHAKV
ncbi:MULTISPECIES: thioesterase II family protein [unclassified Micromonospora]|uniref:thioesterase II family protein n=1 Tax=unclassified Micromonospora TaxID=2617518 RepID=UPI00107591D7